MAPAPAWPPARPHTAPGRSPGLTLALLLLRHGRGAALSPWRRGPARALCCQRRLSGVAPRRAAEVRTCPSPLYGPAAALWPSRQRSSEPFNLPLQRTPFLLKIQLSPAIAEIYTCKSPQQESERTFYSNCHHAKTAKIFLVILNKTLQFKFSCEF